MDKDQKKIVFHFNNKKIETFSCAGETILDVIKRTRGLDFDSPCGGRGICGKCKAVILKGSLQDPSPAEIELLTAAELKKGVRLACLTMIDDDLDVLLEEYPDKANILTSHTGFKEKLDPVIKKIAVTLPCPGLEDQRDDLSRLSDSLKIKEPSISLDLRQNLSQIIRKGNYSVTAAVYENTILALEPDNTEIDNYGIVVDIGTTTVAGYLLNLTTGHIIDIVSELNRQKIFGEDVISRIDYSIQNKNGLHLLQDKITGQIRDMTEFLQRNNNINTENIYSLMITGNTTMIHLFTGMDPANIAAAPFIPAATDLMIYPASEFNFKLPACTAYILPCISGYIGADIVSGIIAANLDKTENLSLLIDIGTNGEIVLGNKEGIVCCSTAAGPAFEGACISNGTGGIPGAVDHVYLNGNDIKFTTIENKPPVGICGSGIIDTAAVLLQAGLIDYTGKITNTESSIVIAKKGESGDNKPVCFNQKDIREVQNAKAAIAAGIKTLMYELGKNPEDIKNVYLAGGFGSFILKESALAIGLIPEEFKNRIKVIGNAAGLGAITVLLSKKAFKRAAKIRESASYIELSSNSFFNTEYIENIHFPETKK